MSRATALVLVFLQLQLLAVALAQKPAAAAAGDDEPSKVGAGFLFWWVLPFCLFPHHPHFQ
jgi:succinate dehydrogenase hydrophobic anchor subunit